MPLEPLCCSRPFSAVKDGLHYLWRGRGPGMEATTISMYRPSTEQWILYSTTGSPPSGLCAGGCVSLGSYLYCTGGYDYVNGYWHNDIHKLNLDTFEWSEVYPRNCPSELPIQKDSGMLVAIDDRMLICFGGWGIGPKQSGSRFIRDRRYTEPFGWTNELHLLDAVEGIVYNCLYIMHIRGHTQKGEGDEVLIATFNIGLCTNLFFFGQ